MSLPADKQVIELTPIGTPVLADLFLTLDSNDPAELKSSTGTQIRDLVQSNLSGVPQSAISNLVADLSNKADVTHPHIIADTTGLQTELDSLAPISHTHLLAAGATDVTITSANLNILDDGADTTLHFHNADRARAVHTGTQTASTISDFDTEVANNAAVNANTNKISYTDAAKVAGIEDNATADQSDAEIKTAYENNADTNEFSDAEQAKLSGISAGATANDTDSNLRARSSHTGTQPASTISDYASATATFTNKTIDASATGNVITNIGSSEIIPDIVNGLTEEVAPTSGDFLLGVESGGALRRIDVGNLPTGGGGESNDGVNVGTGSGIYRDKTGISINLRSIIGGTNVTVTENADDITIDATGGGSSDHGTLTGLGDDDHTQYQLRSEEGAANGYVGLDGSSKITGAFQTYGTVADTACEGDDARLSDARTPLAHTHVAADVTDFAAAVAATASVTTNTNKRTYPLVDETKLGLIEDNAKDDQTGAEIKAAYEAEADTNAFTDAEQTLLGNQSGTNTGDEVTATDTVAGIAERATIAEVNTGTDDLRFISPAGLAGSDLQTKVDLIADGAEVNPDVISQAEAEAATATTERIWTAERVGQAIAANTSGGLFNNLTATVAPDADNDSTESYVIGSVWVDVTNDRAYICVDNTATAAVWIEMAQSSSGLSLLAHVRTEHAITTTTTALDMSSNESQTISITANTTFTTSSRANGRSKTVRIINDATLHTLTFPTGWHMSGRPTDIAASAHATFSLTCHGTADTDVFAAYVAED